MLSTTPVAPFQSPLPLTDELLAAHIRAAISTVVSNPGAVRIEVHGGHVTIAGPLYGDERERLVASIRGIRGVSAVDDRLELHERSAKITGIPQRPYNPPDRYGLSLLGPAPAIAGVIVAAAVGAWLAHLLRSQAEP